MQTTGRNTRIGHKLSSYRFGKLGVALAAAEQVEVVA